MTKSQNTKNEQQKDLCITSEQLTEQWKKGELINGKKYYITFFDSEPFEATFRAYYEAMFPYWNFEANGKEYCDENGYDCVKVLAPVPSYDELQNMNKAVNECMAANIKLIEQNKQLKEQINHLSKTQARQFVDNQKLQVKAEKAKDVVNIDTARQIKQLKELLEECELWFTGIVGNMNDKNVGEHNKSVPIGNFEHIFKEFSQKIDEVLR